MTQPDLFNQVFTKDNPELSGTNLVINPFPVHEKERNPLSSPFLEANKHKFKKQNQQIYDLLMSGKVLTNVNALNDYGIGSLSSRISELKMSGVEITSETSGQARYRIHKMTPEQISANEEKFKIIS